MSRAASSFMHFAVLTVAIVFSAVSAPAPALAASAEIYQSGGGIFGTDAAVGGYDPVAYFKVGMPVEGSDEFETRWKGALWRFSSAENKAAFEASPETYAPQFGGYCAYGVSQNAAVHGDPKIWTIVDNKLYLNINAGVQSTWDQNRAGYISKANKLWPQVLSN